MNEKITFYSVHAALSSDDILCDIILRLPPETVSKVILVSKRWLHLICSPSFRSNYLTRWRAHFHLVGFFVCNYLYLGRHRDRLHRPPSEPALELLSTSKDGDDLKFSGILKELGYFIDSSDGVLLCGRHPKSYYVWNPITQKQYKLPRPRVYFEELCMAFIVEDSTADDISYRVFRAKCERRLEAGNSVSIETFFSNTSTWSYSTLTCSSRISLSPWAAGTVIGRVIHWYATPQSIAVYNPDCEEKHIALINLPGYYDYDERAIGESPDGHLQYGWSNKAGLEIWVLEQGQDSYTSALSGQTEWNAQWSLRYKLNFKIIWRKNPSFPARFGTRTKDTQILSFLPQNSDSVLIRCGWYVFRYDFETEKVEVIHYQGRGSSMLSDSCKAVPCFKLAWPYSSLCRRGNGMA